ncbi:hypothetical protein ACUN0C_15985 [Faunimonas sp. B44]|uniref:hypothetical protein n=1 Tax=Faunimonas sp. B44 TaxID=3461493 RepID=UPI0040445A19
MRSLTATLVAASALALTATAASADCSANKQHVMASKAADKPAISTTAQEAKPTIVAQTATTPATK